MKEKWKSIKGYEGLYMIGSKGGVVSLPRKHQPKGAVLKHPKGGTKVDLRKDGKRVTKGVHQLVGGAFVPNPSHKRLIYHLDGNKRNNRAEYLVWVTPKELRNIAKLKRSPFVRRLFKLIVNKFRAQNVN
jgi:hypothetical protein